MIKFKLRNMLAMHDMSQRELAEKAGVNPHIVSGICTGSKKHISVEALDKICEVLNCRISDLLEYTKESEIQYSINPLFF